MTDLILIDTSVWIEALKKGGSVKAVNRVKKAIDDNSAAITGLIMMELLTGARSKKKYDTLKSDMEALNYLKTTEEIWSKASEIAFILKRKGVNVPNTDVIIAAISIIYKCTLIHLDKHFEFIGKHTVLKEEKLL